MVAKPVEAVIATSEDDRRIEAEALIAAFHLEFGGQDEYDAWKVMQPWHV